jgi:hypothetical protein
MHTSVSTEVPAPASAPAPAHKDVRAVDLGAIPWNLPWALIDEFQAAAILHQSVKVLRRQRHEGVGPRFLKLNGCTVRYKVADLQSFLDAQPTGGGVAPGSQPRRGPGRPRNGASKQAPAA